MTDKKQLPRYKFTLDPVPLAGNIQIEDLTKYIPVLIPIRDPNASPPEPQRDATIEFTAIHHEGEAARELACKTMGRMSGTPCNPWVADETGRVFPRKLVEKMKVMPNDNQKELRHTMSILNDNPLRVRFAIDHPATGETTWHEQVLDASSPEAQALFAAHDNTSFSIRANPPGYDKLTNGRFHIPRYPLYKTLTSYCRQIWMDAHPVADQADIRYGKSEDLRKLAAMARNIAEA